MPSLSFKPATGFLQLAGCIVVALAWLIPNHYPPWSSFYNDSCAELGLLLIACGTFRRDGVSGMPALAWGVLAIGTIPWLQWATGLLVFSGDAWVSSLYLLSLSVAVTTGYQWATEDASSLASTLSMATLAAAMLSTVLALNQVFDIWHLEIWAVEILDGMRAGANLAQSNNLATLIGFAAIALLLLREQGAIGKVPGIALLLLLLVGLSLTQSRISILFGPVIWIGVWLAKRRSIAFGTRLRTIGLVTIASWVFLLGEPPLLRALQMTSLQSVASRGVQSLRFEVWPVLLDGLSIHPWRGYGWLQVGAAELAAADRHPPVGELWLHGHNLFLELVIWCGYPIGIALGVAILYWFITRFVKAASTEAVAGMLVVGVVGLHAMSELPYHYAYFLVPVGLWMGLVEKSIDSPGLLQAKWYPIATAATLALGIAVGWNYPVVEEDFRLVRFENLKVGTLRADVPSPVAPFLSTLTSFLRVSRMTPAPGMSAADLDSMRDVVERYPYAAGMSRYASALALNGRPDEARIMFTKILHIHGKVMYAGVKRNLDEAALGGPPAIRTLEMSVPK